MSNGTAATVASSRSKRARIPPDYLRPGESKIIKRAPRQKKAKQEQITSPDAEKLYRLQVIEEDEEKGLVKVRI